MDSYAGVGFQQAASALWAGAGAGVLAQVVLTASVFCAGDAARVRSRFSWLAILAVLTPLFGLVLLAIALLFEDIAFAHSIWHLGQEGEAFLLSSWVAEHLDQRALAGLVLAASGIAGVACVWLAFWRRGGRSGIPVTVPLAVLAVVIVMVGLGAAFAVRELSLAGCLGDMSYADVASKRSLLAAGVGAAPGLVAGLAVSSMLGLVVLIAVARRARHTRAPGSGWLAVAGLAVLLLGCAAIGATRSHAEDLDRRLWALLGSPYANFDQTHRWYRCAEPLLDEAALELPRLDFGGCLDRQAYIPIAIDRQNASLDGEVFASAADLCDPGHDLDQLSDLLSKSKRDYAQLHQRSSHQIRVAVLADVGTRGLALARVLQACADAGFRRARLVFLSHVALPSAVYERLRRETLAGVDLLPTDRDDPAAIGWSETLGEWLQRTRFADRYAADPCILVRAAAPADKSEPEGE
jgi:hypothetical protein